MTRLQQSITHVLITLLVLGTTFGTFGVGHSLAQSGGNINALGKTATPATVAQEDTATVNLALDAQPCESTTLNPVSVALIIDQSGSMRNGKLTAAKQAAKSFIDNLSQGDQVAVISYGGDNDGDAGDDAWIRLALSADFTAARQAVDSIPLTGNTNIYAGLVKGKDTLEAAPPTHTRMAILLSDGYPTIGTNGIDYYSSWQNKVTSPIPANSARDAATSLKNAGITLYTIGLGSDIDEVLMRAMASTPEQYYQSPTTAELEQIYTDIAGQIERTTIIGKNARIVETFDKNRFEVLSAGDGGVVDPQAGTITWNLAEITNDQQFSYEVRPTFADGQFPASLTTTFNYTRADGCDAAGTAATYTAEAGATITVIPQAAVLVDPTTLTIKEGESADYSLRLARQPTSAVTLTVAYADVQVTPDPTTVTFTSGNWNTPQTVTVIALEGEPNEGEHSTLIVHEIASDDADYAALDVDSVQVNLSEPPADVCSETLDVMLVLDGSRSIGDHSFRQMMGFTSELVDAFTISPDDARFGLVQFASQDWGTRHLRLSGDTTALKHTIDSIRQLKGYTDIEEGLRLARTELQDNARTGVPQAVILFTDGQHNQPGDVYAEAEELHDAGIIVLAVAIGSDPSVDQLKSIVSDPNNYVFQVGNAAELTRIRESLVQTTCSSDLGPGPNDPPVAPQPLTVRSVEPHEGRNDTDTQVTIVGSGFSTGTAPTVALQRGQETFDLTNVTAVSATALQATVPAGFQPGRYDVVVTNPDGTQATATLAFTVLSSAPEIIEVIPAAGYATEETTVRVFGNNFADGISARLGTDLLETRRIDSNQLQMVVPAGMDPGAYDLTVTNPNGSQGMRTGAYTVLSSSGNNDLLGYSYELWVNPVVPRAGEPAQLTMQVHRLGGKQVLENVRVRFMRDSLDGEVLGETSVPFLDPANDTEATQPLEVTFPTTGTFEIYVEIDPGNVVLEDNENNNVVKRTITVAAPNGDQTPPVVQGIAINNGSTGETQERDVTVTINATDNGSGMSDILIVEFIYDLSAEQWIPVNVSDWQPFTQNPSTYDWTLDPTPGMHYLQVRVRDRAGNISVGNAQQVVSYAPTAEQVAFRQTRIYRYNLSDTQQMNIAMDVLSGDADLYVWSSREDQSARVSNLEGTADETVNIPGNEVVPGMYQVEVYGFQTSDYRLKVDIPSTQIGLAGAHPTALINPAANKPAPNVPVVPLTSVPDEWQGAVLSSPGPVATGDMQIYLPLVVR